MTERLNGNGAPVRPWPAVIPGSPQARTNEVTQEGASHDRTITGRRELPGWSSSSARALALVALVVGWLCVPVPVAAPAAPTRADASVMGALTCFAIDVSGSNPTASDGEPPSDPGPVFVRQQVAELYSEILADLGEAANQQVGVVTFGTRIGTEIGPLAISDPAARSQLETTLPRALQPSAAEAAWTNWVVSVSGCEQMFDRSGVTHGMAVVLTDGFPQGPAAVRPGN